MHQTLNAYQVADLLLEDNNAGWSYPGAQALAQALEELDNDTNPDGPGSEFDRVAIRCEFSEYETALAAAREYGYGLDDDDDDDETEANALTWLQERTHIIEFDGGIILQQF